MRTLLSHALGIVKAFIAGCLSLVIAFKQKYCPSKTVVIRLPWCDQWNAIDDYLSFCLRYGIRFEKFEQYFLLSFL
jgi:hypothetical protein